MEFFEYDDPVFAGYEDARDRLIAKGVFVPVSPEELQRRSDALSRSYQEHVGNGFARVIEAVDKMSRAIAAAMITYG